MITFRNEFWALYSPEYNLQLWFVKILESAYDLE